MQCMPSASGREGEEEVALAEPQAPTDLVAAEVVAALAHSWQCLLQLLVLQKLSLSAPAVLEERQTVRERQEVTLASAHFLQPMAAGAASKIQQRTEVVVAAGAELDRQAPTPQVVMEPTAVGQAGLLEMVTAAQA